MEPIIIDKTDVKKLERAFNVFRVIEDQKKKVRTSISKGYEILRNRKNMLNFWPAMNEELYMDSFYDSNLKTLSKHLGFKLELEYIHGLDGLREAIKNSDEGGRS